MKQHTTLQLLALACLWLGASTKPIRVTNEEKQPQRTLLPWLFLLNYPGVYRPGLGLGAALPGLPVRPNDVYVVGATLPGIPIRRPNDVYAVGATLPGIPVRRPNDVIAGGTLVPGVPIRRPNDTPIRRPNDMPQATQRPTQSADPLTSTAQNDANMVTSTLIRDQFIQGLVQGLQTMPANRASTIRPELLADFLQQINAAQSALASTTTRPPNIEKELHSANNNNEADYDYIDFKNGQRIKYELDDDQQQQQQPQLASYNRPQFI